MKRLSHYKLASALLIILLAGTALTCWAQSAAERAAYGRAEAERRARDKTVNEYNQLRDNVISSADAVINNPNASPEQIAEAQGKIQNFLNRWQVAGSPLTEAEKLGFWQRTSLLESKKQAINGKTDEAQGLANQAASQGKSAERIKAEEGKKPPLDCSGTFDALKGECLWQYILVAVANVAMLLIWCVQWVLWGINEIFNQVIQLSVVKFGDYLNNEGIRYAWGVARDLVNVSLLFVLLYAAIGMIIDLQGVDSKRIVSRVIVVALLVNFSFFFTGTVIKISNTVTTFLYTKAGEGVPTTALGAPDISTKLIKTFDPNWTGDSPASKPGEYVLDLTLGKIIMNFFTAIALILITSVVLGAGVVMFAVRFIKLLVLAVLSPLAFLGFTIPAFQNRANDWLKKLLDACIFPIIFLLFFVMVTKLAAVKEIWTFTQNSSLSATIISGLVMGILINGLLVAGLMAASSMSASGAGWATDKLKGMGGWTRGKMGQNTLGRMGYAVNRWTAGDKGQAFGAKHRIIGGALKNWSEKVAKTGYGQKGGSYQKTLEGRAKLVEKFDSPENKAAYVDSLGKSALSNVPVLGQVTRFIPGLGRQKAAQQAAFEKLKDDQKAKAAPFIDTRPGETVRATEQEAEADKPVKDQEKERDKQVLTMETNIANLKKAVEQEKAKPQTPEIVDQIKQLEEKIRTSENSLTQTKQEWEGKISKARAEADVIKSKLGSKTLFQTFRDRMTDKQRGDLTKAEDKKKRDDDEKKIKQKMDLKVPLTDDERKRWQEIRKKKQEEKDEEQKKLREDVNKMKKDSEESKTKEEAPSGEKK